MTRSEVERIYLLHERARFVDREQCQATPGRDFEGRDSAADERCRMDEGHAANHNNGVTSWGHADALEGTWCVHCGSDLLPVVPDTIWICVGCGKGRAQKLPPEVK